MADVVRKNVNFPKELAERIDDFRFSNRIATETEAIKRLVEKGLNAVDSEKEGR